ncbi:MAG: hypothetical protein WCJ28_03320 [Actinomycetota bacterium]
MINQIQLLSALDGDLSADLSLISSTAAERLDWMKLQDLELAIPEIRRIRELVSTHPVLWLGMGGSSMAAWLYAEASDHGSAMRIIDSTHPATFAELPDDPFVFVASKSGGTFEVQVALAALQGAGVKRERCIAVTDEDSPLWERSLEERWAGRLATPKNVGGRFSPLTGFGLLPALLLGLDIEELLRGARAADLEASIAEGFAAAALPGLPLLELMRPASRAFLGLWLEQLIAESSGKNGKGFIPLLGEAGWQGSRQDPQAGEFALGRYLQESMVAVVAMCCAIGVDPFDQPDVDESKRLTASFLAEGSSPVVQELALDGLAGFISATPGLRYVALDAYLDPGRMAEIEQLASRLSQAAGLPVIAGMAPRMLHSTGQLHKGGPDGGLSIQLFDQELVDLAIPQLSTSLALVIRAQADGDAQALVAKGRKVVRCLIGL